MNIVQFLRLVARHLNTMMICGALAAVTVFLLTQNEKKTYKSHTILNTGLVSSYNIESSKGNRIDYAYTNNEMENLIGLAKSREMHIEVALRMLGRALMQKQPSEKEISPESFAEVAKIFPPAERSAFVVENNLDATVELLRQKFNESGENIVKAVLDSKNKFFGLEHLQTLVVRREGNSDMIRVAYSTSDPAICLNTITTLADLFIIRHRAVKEGQTTSVLDFFEQATNESAAALNGKEDALLDFMVGNKIINYYEQTRFIAAKKEDLDEFYYRELMALAAADSSRRNLEAKLESRIQLPEINRNLMARREQLSGVSARLAALEISAATDTVPGREPDSRQVANLKKEAEYLKADIQKSALATFAVERTPEGVETQQVLQRWLDQWIQVEQTLARLGVLRDRKQEFDRIYSRFAPWGSKLKRLEREIDVAERAYLENLHSFNQARLHKYNMVMSTNLRIVDAPFFPAKPESSKRLMMVILAGMVGFIIVLATALAMEFLDQSLHDPERAIEMTGMELAGAFPRIPGKNKSKGKVDYPTLIHRASTLWLQFIKLKLRETGRHEQQPIRIAILSTRSGEGKSFLSSLAVSQLRSAGERVVYLRPQDDQEPVNHPDDRLYPVNFELFERKTEYDLLQVEPFNMEPFNYVVTELPGLLVGNYPADYLLKADIALCVAHANRTWNAADVRSIASINRLLLHPCCLVLNSAQPDNLESALGEVPRSRSILRRWMKKIAQRNFAKTQKQIKI